MLDNHLSMMAQFEPQPQNLGTESVLSNPRNCFAVLAPNFLSFRPSKQHTIPSQEEFIPLSDVKSFNKVNVRKFRRTAIPGGAISLLKANPDSLVMKVCDSATVLQRSDDVRCYLRKKPFVAQKRKISDSSEPQNKDGTTMTAPKRLFVVQNGDLKPILSSNIANSGVFRPSQPRHTAPAKVEPQNIIIADSIRGGIMTPQHYEEELRRVKKHPKKVLYRVMRPNDLNLCSPPATTANFGHQWTKKHATRTFCNFSNFTLAGQIAGGVETSHQEGLLGSSAAGVSTRGRVGRRKGTLKKPPSTQISTEQNPVPTARTRSGRLTRPPRHIHLDYRGNQVIVRPAAQTEVTELEDKAETDRVTKKPRSMKWMMARLKCELCGKFYVSQQKLERHWLTHSEQPCQGSAFEHLLKQLRRVAVENRAKVFVEEIADFVERVQFLAKKLFTHDSLIPMQIVDENAARVLAIPPGAYRFNMTALNGTSETTNTEEIERNENLPNDCSLPEIHGALSDSCISDDPAKINLADISEDSLFQSVEDLVREKIKNLTDEDLANAVPHFETSSVDLSLELFQFHNN
ncbi:hypothetical protein DMENIID0001_126700 [Sergentomyia squamirostris]